MHSTVLTVDGGIGTILNKEPFDAHTDNNNNNNL